MFYNLQKIDSIGPLFNALEKTIGIPQDKEHHPEGDVFTHSLQVMEFAFRESRDIDLILAAMLHDIGKVIDTHEHDKYGPKMLEGYISEKTKWLISEHMRFWYFILGDMKKISKVHDLYKNEWLPDLCMLVRWDKAGRNPNKKITYDRIKIISRLKVLVCPICGSIWNGIRCSNPDCDYWCYY